MIKICSVTILNYRSFRNKRNIFGGLRNINLVVGKNNMGKTNILRAIYIFFNPEMYDSQIDRNMIKQVTGGQAKDPKITIEFEDDEILPEKKEKYKICCDWNSRDSEPIYTIKDCCEEIAQKLENSARIKSYINAHIKCIYLSTTDVAIEAQTEALFNELILQYFKKQNRQIKKTIEEFEQQYKNLMQIFADNINNIETSLSEQFSGMKDMGVTPKLSINKSREITEFLLENIKLQLDDSYIQDIGNKGAGVQRASLIMLSLFLLNEIYAKENKIILLDEPEAFLYPLLVKKVKNSLEENVKDNKKIQMFLTSHSREFLTEINNDLYTFSYVKQEREEKNFQRSKKGIEVNKYSIIEGLNRKNKYELLNNYGLLDEVNDYEYIIVCEGETDRNYLVKILEEKTDIPQIRFGKYADGIGGKELDLNYGYIGKAGTGAILPILAYLDRVSVVSRKVFILLDGDQAGREIAKKIRPEEFEHLEIFVKIIEKDLEIEDVVFSREQFVNRVLMCEPEIRKYAEQYKTVMNKLKKGKSVITQTEEFIRGNGIDNTHIEKIKVAISQNLENETLQTLWIMKDLEDFFYEE